jgi:hypothetical protein
MPSSIAQEARTALKKSKTGAFIEFSPGCFPFCFLTQDAEDTPESHDKPIFF